MQKVLEKSMECKKGSWFITLGSRLPNCEQASEGKEFDPEMQWQVMFAARLPMSWGVAPVVLHKKIKDPTVVVAE